MFAFSSRTLFKVNLSLSETVVVITGLFRVLRRKKVVFSCGFGFLMKKVTE